MNRFHLKAGYLLKKEITELYIANALRTFAISTIVIFIPIFLLKQGFSLLDVAIFFVFRSMAAFVFNYTALRYVAKKGVKHSMLVSVPFLIAFFIGLYSIEPLRAIIGDYPLLLLLGVLEAMSAAYYYMGFHVEFARFSERKKAAEQFGIVNIFSTAFSIIGPLCGALVITYLSFNIMFVIVMLLLFFAILPLFMSKEVHEPFDFKLNSITGLYNMRRGMPFFAEGLRNFAASIHWPVLMYFLFTALDSIGGVYTVSNALLVMFTMYVGHKTTDATKYRIMNIGSFLHSVTLVVRTMMKTLFSAALVQGFGAVTWPMVQLPFYSIFYNNSKKKGMSDEIHLREVYLHAGRIFSALVLAALLFHFSPVSALSLVIILGAVATFFMARIKDEPVASGA